MMKQWMAYVVLAGCLTGGVMARAQEPKNTPLDQIPVKRAKGTTVRIELVGDSTLTPTHGWYLGFCANLTPQVDCITMGKGGASTKTYIADGSWKLALATKPDYMLIQFAGNDVGAGAHKARETTTEEFAANIRTYITEARAAGITPVIVGGVVRRIYGPDGKIASPYTVVVNAEKAVAEEMHVPFMDLHADSIAYLNTMTPAEGQKKVGRTAAVFADRVQLDNSHMNSEGSYIFGRMAAEDMGKAVPALAKYVKPTAAPFPSPGWPVPRNAPEKGEKD